ncbi:hypothetical protein [Chloroflexus sp.]|nr:hypothetical protein [Chloroflexus sp.]
MAHVKVFYDQAGNTLTVWFDQPQDEYTCKETDSDLDEGSQWARDRV